MRIDTGGDDLGKVQFIDEERSGMPIVEDDRMSKRIGFDKVGILITDQTEKGFIFFETVLKIGFDLLTLGFRVTVLSKHHIATYRLQCASYVEITYVS